MTTRNPERIQGPHVELSFVPTCEHMCVGICGASTTASGKGQTITPEIFEERVLLPLAEKGLKPAMVTLTGGSISMPANQEMLFAHLDMLQKHRIPIKLSTTMVWDNKAHWRYFKRAGYDIRRVHSSYRDLTPELTEVQARFPGSGPVILRHINDFLETFPDVPLEVETLVSSTLGPHLPDIGRKLIEAIKGINGVDWQWQLQTIKASGNARELKLALLDDELFKTLEFLGNGEYLKLFGVGGIKLLCMPPICTETGAKIQRLIDSSGGKIITSRCTEGQVSTREGVPSGVMYISGGVDGNGREAMFMRPCFIVDSPHGVPNLLEEDAGEAFLNSPFLRAWRDPKLVPEICNSCKIADHGDFRVQNANACVPNCRASACSLDTTNSLGDDLKRMPTDVERCYQNSAVSSSI